MLLPVSGYVAVYLCGTPAVWPTSPGRVDLQGRRGYGADREPRIQLSHRYNIKIRTYDWLLREAMVGIEELSGQK